MSEQLQNVHIEGGLISGVKGENPGVTIFKGIPYAAPPIGKLRWRPPQPVEPWEGVRRCDTFSKICPQVGQPSDGFYRKEFYYTPDPESSEDCLYLNVWAPAQADKCFPVAIYVHGGSFDHGWSYENEFDGEAFSLHNVILVTINYRVNVYGFLAHPLLLENAETKHAGNIGMLDVIQAVKWVHKNISSFGGDNKRITLFGQSAGSYLATLVAASEETKGLIENVILQSGIGYGDDSLPVLAPKDAEELSTKILEPFNPKSLSDLMALTTEDLSRRFTEFAKTQQGVFMLPVLDGVVVAQNFTDAVDKGVIHAKSFMMGSNSDDIFVDLFKKSTVKLAVELSKQPGKRAFVYYFDRNIPGEDKPGGFHSAELWYMFGTYKRCWRPFEKYDEELSEKMVSYWCNFITNGDPNGENLEKWPQISSDKLEKIEFGDKISTILH